VEQRNLALGRWAFLKIEQQTYIHWGGQQKSWAVAEGRCVSIEETGDKFVLSFK